MFTSKKSLKAYFRLVSQLTFSRYICILYSLIDARLYRTRELFESIIYILAY
jgi:hypothetical protein